MAHKIYLVRYLDTDDWTEDDIEEPILYEGTKREVIKWLWNQAIGDGLHGIMVTGKREYRNEMFKDKRRNLENAKNTKKGHYISVWSDVLEDESPWINGYVTSDKPYPDEDEPKLYPIVVNVRFHNKEGGETSVWYNKDKMRWEFFDGDTGSYLDDDTDSCKDLPFRS